MLKMGEKEKEKVSSCGRDVDGKEQSMYCRTYHVQSSCCFGSSQEQQQGEQLVFAGNFQDFFPGLWDFH